MKRRNNGFTLVEMLAVVVIIATLAAMIVPRFTGRSEEARRTAASADVQANIAGALDLYELDNGAFPTTEQGLDALKREPTAPPAPRRWRGPYLKRRRAVKDPWGRAYDYVCPGVRNPEDYDLSSAGPDGASGTADDVANWDGDAEN